jgi:hypothetical protein
MERRLAALLGAEVAGGESPMEFEKQIGHIRETWDRPRG